MPRCPGARPTVAGPTKEMFFNDLLKELAKAARPAAVAGFAHTVPLMRKSLSTIWMVGQRAEGRGDLVRELIRQGALNDFETHVRIMQWRTVPRARFTFLSVADDDLRRSLQVALADLDRDFIARIARGWSQLAGLFGYRLRAELDATFETVATASATLRGLVIMALSTPDIASRRLQARPLGARGYRVVARGPDRGEHRRRLPSAGSGYRLDPRTTCRRTRISRTTGVRASSAPVRRATSRRHRS